MNRIKHYIRNTGPLTGAINLAVLAYFIYLAFASLATIAAIIVIPITVAGLLGPALLLPLLRPRASKALRITRALTLAAALTLILIITGVIAAPPLIFIAIAAVFTIAIGTDFWILSDPAITTSRALDRQPR